MGKIRRKIEEETEVEGLEHLQSIGFSKSQFEFINSTAQYRALVTGYGGGKTLVGTLWLLDLCYLFPRIPNLYAAPTYSLVRDIFYPTIEELLTAWGVGYRVRKDVNVVEIEGAAPILCRTLEEPDKLVGFQVGSGLLDEFDILRTDLALKAWRKVMARCRKKYPTSNNIVNLDGTPYRPRNCLAITTTPEGFKATYELFYGNDDPRYHLIQGSTYENAEFLPDDYIDGLLSSYPENLVEAYINGQFVNLVSGSVYPNFDREENACTEVVQGDEPLAVGCDFNVLYGAAVVHVLRGDSVCAVDEVHNSFDTDETIAVLKDRYPNNPIVVYPDATGDSRTSANTTTSDIRKLKSAGFRVKSPTRNPSIKNRVASLNALILNGHGERRYKVNGRKCPNLVSALEQQVYADNGQPDKSGGLDHIVDAAGYYTNYEFGLTKPRSGVVTVTGGY